MSSAVATEVASRRSLTVNILWLAAARTLAFALSFALPLVLVRLLGQTEFGLYKQVFLLVGTVSTALPLGFVMSAFYFLPRQDAEGRAGVVLNILLFYAAVGGASAFALLCFPETLVWLFNAGELVAVAPWIAAVVWLWVLGSLLDYLMIANHEATHAARLIVGLNLTRVAALLAAVLVAPSVTALLYAAAAHGALQLGCVLWYARSRFPRFHRPGPDHARLLREQLTYALPLGLAALLWWLLLDLHNYFVAQRFGPTVYAVYAVGCLNIPFLLILNDSVGSMLIQRVSQLERDGRRDEMVATLVGMTRRLALVYFPLYTVLLVTGRELIVVLFTSQYEASWPIFATHIGLIPSSILLTVCDAVVRAYPELRYFLLRVRVPLIALLVVGLWLGTRQGTPLAAIALVVAVNTLERLVIAVKVARKLRLDRHDLAALRPLLHIVAACVAAGVVAGTVRGLLGGSPPLVNLVLSWGAFVATYLLGGWMLGVLTAGEARVFRQLFGRAAARP